MRRLLIPLALAAAAIGAACTPLTATVASAPMLLVPTAL
jgi:hypothetical protein